MKVHILGICGTFMGGVAILAKEKGFQVSGSDAKVYPPMSLQLASQGISLSEGYEPEQLNKAYDQVIIGNALSRGRPVVEAVLSEGYHYTSGPQWVAENILRDRWVLAVAGTHGKTTTTSMLAWILEYAGLQPGFLIGGVPENFGVSARLGQGNYFVIEADEYDSAFFDKRSKFIHYHPKTVILNNLEYDHADIFPDLAAIQQQFHYFVRTVPSNGCIIHHGQDSHIAHVLEKGCWTPTQTFALKEADWHIGDEAADGSSFSIFYAGKMQGRLAWRLLGKHNMSNALAAIAAAHHVGVEAKVAIQALHYFKSVKRRLEVRGERRGITVYDDFAHHPTAIETTIEGLRAKVGDASITVVLECASNTMRRGVHRDRLASSLKQANKVIFLRPQPEDWGIASIANQLSFPTKIFDHVDEIMEHLVIHSNPGDHILLMSNGGFGGLPDKLLRVL